MSWALVVGVACSLAVAVGAVPLVGLAELTESAIESVLASPEAQAAMLSSEPVVVAMSSVLQGTVTEGQVCSLKFPSNPSADVAAGTVNWELRALCWTEPASNATSLPPTEPPVSTTNVRGQLFFKLASGGVSISDVAVTDVDGHEAAADVRHAVDAMLRTNDTETARLTGALNRFLQQHVGAVGGSLDQAQALVQSSAEPVELLVQVQGKGPGPYRMARDAMLRPLYKACGTKFVSKGCLWSQQSVSVWSPEAGAWVHRPAADVRAGDRVLSVARDGASVSEVFFSHCSEAKVPLVRLELRDGQSLSVTPTHLVSNANGGLVKAADVAVGDALVVVEGGDKEASVVVGTSVLLGSTCHVRTASGMMVAGGVAASVSSTQHWPSLALWAPIQLSYALFPELAKTEQFVRGAMAVSDTVEGVYRQAEKASEATGSVAALRTALLSVVAKA